MAMAINISALRPCYPRCLVCLCSVTDKSKAIARNTGWSSANRNGTRLPTKASSPGITGRSSRFFTAEPGPLPTGTVVGVGSLEPVLAAEGVVQADTYIQLGETIRPVRRDGDRRGYVIAIAGTSDEALRRAEAAARLFEVEVQV